MIGDTFRRLKYRHRLAHAKAELAARSTESVAHNLSTRLVVSLTSYRPRFSTLRMTLACLLRQSVRPDRTILWVSEPDFQHLPEDVLSLSSLEIMTCPDWRSYKKIVPTLLVEPDAFIVTADDDSYYPPNWLAGLVAAAYKGASVACYRAHRIVLHENKPAPYGEWQNNIDFPEQSPLIFPTGVSGVIYAPGVFHKDVTQAGLFTALAPTTDDVWLYWMHRLTGAETQKIGRRARILEWEDSQAESLRDQNVYDLGNDRAIAALIANYGWPG